MNEQVLKQNWKNENFGLGKKCGFPECCINEFCEQPPEIMRMKGPTIDDKMRFEAAKINGKFTGFIPCKLHAAQIIKGMIKLPDLINDRSKDLPPFPYFGGHEM